MDAFVKIPGIEGDGNDSQHQGWIRASNFSVSVHNVPGGDAGHGRLRIEKMPDVATPQIAAAVLGSMQIPEIVIEFLPKGLNEVRFRIRLKGARIEGQTIGEVGPYNTAHSAEILDIHYAGFEYECAPSLDDAPVIFAWPAEVPKRRVVSGSGGRGR